MATEDNDTFALPVPARLQATRPQGGADVFGFAPILSAAAPETPISSLPANDFYPTVTSTPSSSHSINSADPNREVKLQTIDATLRLRKLRRVYPREVTVGDDATVASVPSTLVREFASCPLHR